MNVKKVHMGYLFTFLLLPAAGLTLLILAVVLYVKSGIVAFVLITVPTILAIFWWAFFGDIRYDRRRKQMLQEMAGQGFIRSHIFEGDSTTVLLDQVNGKLGLLFRWNPYQYYVLPAAHISKVWVDDGCSGVGLLRGTSRVRVLFTVEGVTVRVSTFTSNRLWRPDSDNVLVGISKADLMAELLNAARGDT